MKENMTICIVNSSGEKIELEEDSFKDQLEDEENYTDDNTLVLSFSINYGELTEMKLLLQKRKKIIEEKDKIIKEKDKEKSEINQKYSKIIEDLFKESENIKRYTENINTIILGYFAKKTQAVSIESLLEVINETFPGKVGELNVEATKKAYDMG